MAKKKVHSPDGRSKGLNPRLAAFAVTRTGYALAMRLKKLNTFKGRFIGLKVFTPAEIKKNGIMKTVNAAFGVEPPEGDQPLQGDYDGLIFICASGIAVRAVAPHLKGKQFDPAVVVIDEQGRFAISLLSGHLGGANELARDIAFALDATPVITTATDGAGLPCVEDIAKKFSLTIDDVKKIKCVNAAILSGGPVSIVDADVGRLGAMKRAYAGAGVFTFKTNFPTLPPAPPHPALPRKGGGDMEVSIDLPSPARGVEPPEGAQPLQGEDIGKGASPAHGKSIKAFVIVSNSAQTALPKGAAGRTLILRPREFVVGIGCGRLATAAQIRRVVKKAFDSAGLSMLCIRNLATIDIKAGEKGLIDFARSLNVPVEYFKSSILKTQKPPSGPSAFVLRAAGCPAVAEPAALLSAKAKRLWIKKWKTGKVTAAAARVSSRW